MQFLQDLQLQKLEKALAKSTASYNAASQKQGKGAARQKGSGEVKLSSRKNIAEFHSQLRQLNALHLEDISSRKELYNTMDQMKQRIRLAVADIQAAGARQPRIQSQTENALKKINEKYGFLVKAESSISTRMRKEVILREQMLALAGKMVLDLSSSSTTSPFEKDVARFQTKLLSGSDAAEVSQALRDLRDSMDVHIDMNDILRAAEGGSAGGGI
jgi:dsDNA-specific endonuclease/ATPase MutS2